MPVHITVPKSPFALKRLQREVNILLISDLHYNVEKEREPGYDTTYKATVINKHLVDCIVSQDPDWYPDIVIIAGDLVNRNILENYRDYEHLMSLLVEKFPPVKHTVFTTPGNHDVDRNKKADFIGKLDAWYIDKPSYRKTFTDEQHNDMIHTFSKEDFAKKPVLLEILKVYEEEAFKIYLFNQSELIRQGKLSAYPEIKYPVPTVKTCYTAEVHGVSIASHNSSYFCSFSYKDKPCTWDDRNNLFLIREFVDKTLENLSTSNPVISFMHHPFYFLNETDHISPISREEIDLLNNFTKIAKKSDLILCGHVHGDLHEPAYLQNSSYLVTNGTSFTTDSFEEKCYPFTYALIKVNKQVRNFSLKKFIYHPENTTTGKVANFYEKPNKIDKPFVLQQKQGIIPFSMEAEKVRTLAYFLSLSEFNVNAFFNFFVYQLRLFHATEIEDKDIDVTFVEMNKFGKDVIKIETGKFPFFIVLINEETIKKDIWHILENYLGDFDPEDGLVYFSLNLKLFKDGSEFSGYRIQSVYEYFRALVSMSKIDFVSVNLLYHQR